jgi:hypothetical protein
MSLLGPEDAWDRDQLLWVSKVLARGKRRPAARLSDYAAGEN